MASSANSRITELLPEELRLQFRRLERRLWWLDTTIAFSGSAMGVLISYALLFVSDRLWDTPHWMRACAFLLGFGLTIYFLRDWVWHWWRRRGNTRALSRVIQRRHRRLGDRLLGIVELAEETREIPGASSDLRRAAIRQVAEEAAAVDFRNAVAARRPRLFALGALLLLFLVAIPCMVAPRAAWNTWQRWLLPGGAVPRYTFVRMESLPEELVVPRGEAFELAFQVERETFWKPGTVRARLGEQFDKELPIGISGVQLTIPGQVKPETLHLRTGDISKQIEIVPRDRPGLETVTAEIELPDYLQRGVVTQQVQQGILRFVEGSRARFGGAASAPLAHAKETALNAGGRIAFERELAVRRHRFLSSQWMLDELREGRFTWRDTWGLASAEPWKLQLESAADRPPAVACPDQAAAVAMLPGEVLEVAAVAEDDYGLKILAMDWECRLRGETNLVAGEKTMLAEGNPYALKLEGRFTLSPVLMDLPEGSVVTLRAAARDYFPDRADAESTSFLVYILSPEEHARLIQQELERITAEVEDLARQQESLLQEGQMEQARMETGGQRGQELEEQGTRQEQLSRRLDALAERVAEALEEGLRNDDLPASLLQDWARHAQAMRQTAGRPMTLAAQSLREAAQAPSGREAAMEEALAQEQDALDALEELQKKLGPAMDRFLANTLVQRFRGLAEDHGTVNRQLQELLPVVIGLPPEQVAGAARETMQRLSRRQDQAREESLQLQEEVSRFYERTVERVYGTVAHEMKSAETAATLKELSDLIAQNIGARAREMAEEWQGRFHDWADKLEGANHEAASAGSSSGSGSSLSEQALARMLALMRLRMKEIALRRQTQVLEERKATHQGYREDAIMLSLHQMFLHEDTEALDRLQPGKFLPYAMQAMKEAEGFLMKPQTDQPAQEAETDAVNLLESELNAMIDQAQGTSLAAAMSLMMQRMGLAMNAGNSPGGSPTGGDGELDGPTGLEGELSGGGEDSEDTERVSGGRTRPVPVEYREAMQQYQKGLETLRSKTMSQP